VVPGFSDEYIVNSITHAVELRAIVLELYGTGNLPNRKASLISALERAVEKGIAVVASSQCLRGTVDLRAYELGRRLEQIGSDFGGRHDHRGHCDQACLPPVVAWHDTAAAPALHGQVLERRGHRGAHRRGRS